MILGDDGELTPEVGSWAEHKYALLEKYCEIFSTSMKEKWDARVYLDLFAGPGRVRIRGTSRIVASSPTIALSVRHPFDRYVFVDIEPANIEALERRARRDFPGRDVVCIAADANASAGAIADAATQRIDVKGMLAFCVLDPFAIANLKFATVRHLSRLRMDFLILIPSEMDASRNQKRLLQPDYQLLDDFLGSREWRGEWARLGGSTGSHSFGAFVVDQFGRSMASLGYQYDGPAEAEPIRRDDNRILYYLAFYSRHPLGRKFWEQSVAYGDRQTRLL